MASETRENSIWDDLIPLGGVLLVFFLAFPPRPHLPPLMAVHREAVNQLLDTQGLDTPSRLELDPTGFVIADYEIREGDLDPPIPLTAFAAARLWVIRDALLPHGYVDYRVNLTASTKAARERWLGSARFLGQRGQLEWIDPSGAHEIR